MCAAPDPAHALRKALLEVCAELRFPFPPGPDLQTRIFEWVNACASLAGEGLQQPPHSPRVLAQCALNQLHGTGPHQLNRYSDTRTRTGDRALASLAWRAFRHEVGDQLNTNPL